MYYMQAIFACDINSYIDITCVLWVRVYVSYNLLYQFHSMDCGIKPYFVANLQCEAKENRMLRIVLYLCLEYYFSKQECD
jgi:hypothetical protein